MKKLSVFSCAVVLIFGGVGNTDAELLDRGGGLIYDDVLDITWLQDANYAGGTMTWDEAIHYAESLVWAGFEDWHLPRASELESLLDRNQLMETTRYRPAMRKEVPFRDSRSYWSATTFGKDKKTAWIVTFDGAYVLSYAKGNHYHVRCVRTRNNR